MSELRVEVSKIDQILPCPNADRLEVAVVKGWNCVVSKGSFLAGDVCLYIPVDSVLSADVENIIFPPDSKIKLSHSRIRTIRIRQQISQGLVVRLESLGLSAKDYKVGDDLAEKLGITKYEPQQRSVQFTGKQVSKRLINPYFKEYTDIENVKWGVPFAEGEEVAITSKIHGSNFRAGWVPKTPRTLFDKLRKLVGLLPKWEFVYGSRRVQLNYRKDYKGYYDENIYLEMVKKYRLQERIPMGHLFYGEVYGDGVQKNYLYDCKPGERKLIIFDIRKVEPGKDPQYLDWNIVKDMCESSILRYVPERYVGPYDPQVVKTLSNTHPSALAPSQAVEEGVVVKALKEVPAGHARKIVKSISDAYYLDSNNTDHH